MRLKGSAMKQEEKVKTLQSQIVRYANALDTKDMSKLNPVAQNIMALLLSEWKTKKQARVEIPFAQVKKQILAVNQNQGNDYIKKQTKVIMREIVRRSVVEGSSEEYSFAVMVLIPFVGLNSEKTALVGECRPELLAFFEHLKNGYTEYKLSLFTSLRGVFSKNLFRLFSRYYRGHCTLETLELLDVLGLPPNTTGGRMMESIKRGVAELLKKRIYEEITVKPVRADSRGSPITSVIFEYKISESVKAKLAGQEQLPGLADDGAALPPKQAAPGEAAASAPMPPAAAEKPLLTGEDLIKPSAEQILQAIAADGPAKPSGNAGGGKPAAPEAPICPRCHSPLVMRTNSKDGRTFWGCSSWPKCNYSMNFKD